MEGVKANRGYWDWAKKKKKRIIRNLCLGVETECQRLPLLTDGLGSNTASRDPGKFPHSEINLKKNHSNFLHLSGSECYNYTTLDASSHSLHTPTFPGRVLPNGVVDKIVVQKREVVVERYWPTAGLRGRVLGWKPSVVNEVVKDFVVVGLGLPAGSGAVPEYHLLTGAVTQTEVRHVEVDLFEHAALSSSITSSSDVPPSLPRFSSASSSFTTLLALHLLPLPSSSSPSARVVFERRGGGGRGGRWGHGGWGGAPYSTDGHFDEVHHVFKLVEGGFLHGVWNTLRQVALLQERILSDSAFCFTWTHHTGYWTDGVLWQKLHMQRQTETHCFASSEEFHLIWFIKVINESHSSVCIRHFYFWVDWMH